MKKRMSITTCRHAILITERRYEPGIPLQIDGEEQRITDIEIQGGRWYSGDYRLTRQEQEQLTRLLLAIIERDRRPHKPPTISIRDCRDCQTAIRIAGGIKISLRGRKQPITEVRTGGEGNCRQAEGFKIEVLPWDDPGAVAGRAVSAGRGLVFRVGTIGGRM